ncbi:PTS system IIB component [Mycoplasmopsis maculosa]|uniref:PTS system IIB component n=1 Tax=Mycoplasmopsis maculosa TaxID=114885 RepID=A0A449B438_9BACT|nr:PTS transporter subunit EIIB [Mycoplasmopsis maculosa]VEU75350.1 PTS system IIB component [Mycoplasmopsis maculosa]
MTKKDKFIVFILTIVTFGFCWLYWKIQHKKRQNIINGNYKKLDSSIDIEELINLVGGKENILKAESTISRVKIFINDKKNVNIDKLNNLKYISGLMISTNSISINVGDYAKKIAIDLQNKLV